MSPISAIALGFAICLFCVPTHVFALACSVRLVVVRSILVALHLSVLVVVPTVFFALFFAVRFVFVLVLVRVVSPPCIVFHQRTHLSCTTRQCATAVHKRHRHVCYTEFPSRYTDSISYLWSQWRAAMSRKFVQF